jgi:hypothetical protein
MRQPVSFRALALLATGISLAGCSASSHGSPLPGTANSAAQARAAKTGAFRPVVNQRGVPFVGRPDVFAALEASAPAGVRTAASEVAAVASGKKSAAWKTSVFVSDFGANNSSGAVYQFAPSKAGKILGTINDVVNPQGLDMDAKGDLWVASTGSYSINEYAPGTYKASTVLNDTGWFPVSVAVCPNGTVYALNSYDVSFGPGEIAIYAAGSTTSSSTVPDANVYVPYFGACDQNNVFWYDYADFNFDFNVASYNGSTVTEYGSLGIGFPGGIRIGNNGTTLGIDDQYAGVDLFTESNPSAGPYLTLPVANDPVSFSFNKTQANVWVADYGSTDVLEFVLKTGKQTVAEGAKTLKVPTDALDYPLGNT